MVVGGATSACFDSSARASAVAKDAIVARNPEVARPVAKMRPAAATWRRRLPNNEMLVCLSITGTWEVEPGSMMILAALAAAAAVAGGPAGGLHGAPPSACSGARCAAAGCAAALLDGLRWPSLASRAACCALTSAGAVLAMGGAIWAAGTGEGVAAIVAAEGAGGVAADGATLLDGLRLPSLARRASCCSLSSVIGSSRLRCLPVEVAGIPGGSAELAYLPASPVGSVPQRARSFRLEPPWWSVPLARSLSLWAWEQWSPALWRRWSSVRVWARGRVQPWALGQGLGPGLGPAKQWVPERERGRATDWPLLVPLRATGQERGPELLRVLQRPSPDGQRPRVRRSRRSETGSRLLPGRQLGEQPVRWRVPQRCR
ncbi:MAG: hypothetical protein QOC57_2547 [Ilumatobacteraceae bacterium]